MTIPRRTDISSGAYGSKDRMKVLANLPHVGESAAVPPVNSRYDDEVAPRDKSRTRSTHPAFAELDEFEEVQPAADYRRRQMRYVDQAHVDHEWEQQEEYDEEFYEVREQRRRPQNQGAHRQPYSHHQRNHSRGLGGLLSGVHGQLAPLAGLIVTAALIACAGLLFVMISGGKQQDGELDDFALPGRFALPGLSVEAAEGELIQQPDPLVDSSFAPEVSDDDGLEYKPAETSDQEIAPVSPAPADASAAIPQPVIEQIVEATPPLGELSFPVTGTPLALDYSKAVGDVASKPVDSATAALQQLPTVAERDNATTEPINR